ncbi:MAG TPA: hypothetical protein VM433_02470 [Mycobacteriales bacterium]|nr:hypothetical protein [Mycobacteriales bacterium]
MSEQDEQGAQSPSHPEADMGGGRSQRGPSTSVPGEQEPGGVVPPYEDRKDTAEPDQEGGSVRDGARVGGATGPISDDEFKAPSPSDTAGGRTASPADEQPAADMPDGPSAESGEDRTAHTPGTPKGERGGA